MNESLLKMFREVPEAANKWVQVLDKSGKPSIFWISEARLI
jgi:hypothetical protein